MITTLETLGWLLASHPFQAMLMPVALYHGFLGLMQDRRSQLGASQRIAPAALFPKAV